MSLNFINNVKQLSYFSVELKYRKFSALEVRFVWKTSFEYPKNIMKNKRRSIREPSLPQQIEDQTRFKYVFVRYNEKYEAGTLPKEQAIKIQRYTHDFLSPTLFPLFNACDSRIKVKTMIRKVFNFF